MLYTDCRFGVEMEFSRISRKAAATALSNYFGTSHCHIGGAYDTYECYDQNGRSWNIVRDSSIRSVDANGNSSGHNYQCELVTPVLSFDDMPLLMEVFRQLRSAGAKSNTSCGMHVHISASEQFGIKQIVNLVNMVHSKQDLLYEALDVYNERRHYCKKIPDELCTTLKSKRPQTIESAADIWYDVMGGQFDRGSHYNSSRYHCLNLHNLFSGRLPAVEFRCANGGFSDVRRIKAIIEFYALMVAYSFNVNTCSFKATDVAEGKSKKYAFRVFMLKIGAIGPELAICRKFMLKNLDGNIAWSDR